MKRKMTKREAYEYLTSMRGVLEQLYGEHCKYLPRGAHIATSEVLIKFASAIRTLYNDGYEPDEHEFDN